MAVAHKSAIAAVAPAVAAGAAAHNLPAAVVVPAAVLAVVEPVLGGSASRLLGKLN